MPRLLEFFLSSIARKLASLVGDFLLGTSSSGELCPSEMQNEPPLDPRLLADFAGVDDRKMGLKGRGEGGVGPYMGDIPGGCRPGRGA